jgi:hypothetical protein
MEKPIMTVQIDPCDPSLFPPSALAKSVGDLNAQTRWFNDPSRCAEDNVGPFLLVVDDFYRTPKAIRALGRKRPFVQYSPPLAEQVGEEIAAKYRHHLGTWSSTALSTFMGLTVLKPVEGFAYRPDSLRERLAQLLGESIPPVSWQTGGDRWNGVFHLIDGDWAAGRGSMHHHYKPGDVDRGWSGLVYLSPDAPASSGTSIWRDKRTGLCVAGYGPKFDDDVRNFELALLVENRFNRLVLFRENVIHRAEHGFGYGKNARLTQTFFFCTELKTSNPSHRRLPVR